MDKYNPEEIFLSTWNYYKYVRGLEKIQLNDIRVIIEIKDDDENCYFIFQPKDKIKLGKGPCKNGWRTMNILSNLDKIFYKNRDLLGEVHVSYTYESETRQESFGSYNKFLYKIRGINFNSH